MLMVMIVVIIAGGSGTRLWPLSTPAYPKHLLSINGDSRSLLQNTYKRAKQLANDIYVITEIGHLTHVKQQLPELDDDKFIVEPARRGTANCVLAALSYVGKRHGADEAVAMIAADHYIRDTAGFAHSFNIASAVAEQRQRIVLVGIEPDFPATGFGYIHKGKLSDDEQFVFNVQSFKEKPDYELAKKYFRTGEYLWNAGYFVATVKAFKDSMRQYAPELFAALQHLEKAKTKAQFEKTYLGLATNAIDYALIEKVPNLLVVPATFDWMDLGSFGDLHKAVESNELGNHVHGTAELEEVENSFIHNFEGKPMAVIGLDNVVIINSPNGILVARKDLSQKVGDISKRFPDKSKT